MIDLNITKEVLMTESTSIINVLDVVDKYFFDFINEIYKSKGRVVVVGMGKSGYVAKKMSATLSSTGTPSIFIHPAEAIHGDLGMVSSDDIILMLSFSGETSEILKLIPFFNENKNTILSITNNLKSTLAKYSKFTIPLHIKKEACSFNLAPTASSTTTLAVGDAIAITLMSAKGFTEKDFAKYHPGGSLGRRLLTKVSDEMVKDNLPIAYLNDSIMDVILTISEKKMGVCLILSRNNSLMGVITDGDIRRGFQKHTERFIKLYAVDIMNQDPITINEDIMVVEAEKIMDKNKIHQLIVVDDQQKVLGILPYREKLVNL
jgi:arabinose-5-phosphate isomerase